MYAYIYIYIEDAGGGHIPCPVAWQQWKVERFCRSGPSTEDLRQVPTQKKVDHRNQD